MKRQINQQHNRIQGHKKNFDYNRPLNKCVVCYTISGWYCYECGNHFCVTHFDNHKQLDNCNKRT
jgi:hypothetical protein